MTGSGYNGRLIRYHVATARAGRSANADHNYQFCGLSVSGIQQVELLADRSFRFRARPVRLATINLTANASALKVLPQQRIQMPSLYPQRELLIFDSLLLSPQ